MYPTKATPWEVKERMDQGERLVLVDARSPEAWEASSSKLPGAIRIPPTEAETHLQEIPRDRPIITYCTCPREESSVRVAQVLQEHGWKQANPLLGGFEAWRAVGYPVEPK